MTIQWADIRELSVDECKADILSMLSLLGFSATSWQEGSVPAALVQIGALVWSRTSAVAVALRDMAHNDTATGDTLTRLSASVFDNARTGAVAAEYTIRVSCSAAAGPYTIALGGLVVTDGTHTYRNVDDGDTAYPHTLASGTLVALQFQAETPGAASSVTATDIDTLVTALAGVTLSGQTQLVAGVDAESDVSLRARNRSKWGSLAIDAVKLGVTNLVLDTVPGITRVAVDDSNPDGPGTFRVYCASKYGTAAGADVTAARTAVRARVFDGGNVCSAYSATANTIAVTGTVWYAPQLTSAETSTACKSALREYLASVPIGGVQIGSGMVGTVPLNELENALRSMTIGGVPAVRAVRLTLPTGDTTISETQVPVLGTVTLTMVPAVS